MRSSVSVPLIAGAMLGLALNAGAEPLPRNAPSAGTVIARKAGEEVRFFDVSNWRYVDLQQSLATDDVLRTNATGQLAVLFSDRTQVRLGRNTSLIVKKIETSGDSGLELQSGTIWARAERGGPSITVDTPAATAAIRGTDWTLTVDAKGLTSLIVLEGKVALSNAQGNVTVGAGEAAVAAIGQAPRKIVIVDPKDREQMLFYLSLHGAFTFMPASALPVPVMRRETARIEALRDDRRTAEDWLTLAETSLSLRGQAAAAIALGRAEASGLSGAQRARADLIRALMAGSEKRYDRAAALFARALPRLDARRRAIAAYGGYFARALADPNRSEPPPADASGPYGALAKSYATGFLKDIKAAIAVLKEAEAAYPDDATLPAARAQFAFLLDDRDQARSAIHRALTLDPDDPLALEGRANLRAGIEGDLDGALADIDRALSTTSGSTTLWNLRGQVESARNANRNAERAYHRSIELDPQDPVAHANLAILLLDEGRVAEAGVEIDHALKADPGFDIALIARGRYHLQTGEMDKALEDLLAGSVANPGYAQGQLLLSSAYYERGEREPAAQALDNADRLDPNDPATAAVRTAIAIDDYDSEKAIASAQDFLKRSRAKGGRYAALGGNQAAGSTLNSAFRLQGLDAWGQYYGDAVFDPFSGSAYLDQTIRGSVNPFSNSVTYGSNATDFTQNSLTFSSLIQGLMFEPHMLAGRSQAANLYQRPFLEGSIGAGITSSQGQNGATRMAELQGYSNAPFPISVYGLLEWENEPELRPLTGLDGAFATNTEITNANAYATATPSPDDRIVAYADHVKTDLQFATSLIYPGIGLIDYIRLDAPESTNAGIGWSHSFDYCNVVNAALFYSDLRSDVSEVGSLLTVPISLAGQQTRQTSRIAALNHTVDDGDLTWRYGLEGGTIAIAVAQATRSLDPDNPEEVIDTETRARDTLGVARAYVDTAYDLTPAVKLEGAVFASYLDGQGGLDVARLEPRAGITYTPAEGHWLRAAYLREGLDLDLPTLSPIGMVGLQSNQRSLSPEGYSDTVALRWDAEWTARLFTTVDYQHQVLNNLAIDIPLTVGTIDLAQGWIDRVGSTANLVLGHGFGLSGTFSLVSSENQDATSSGYGGPLPYVADRAGQVALTYVNDHRVKATLAANYTGERSTENTPADLTTTLARDQGDTLDGYWTLDAALTWEPFDKAMAFDLSAYNLTDEDFEVAPNIPGWGRSFKASVKIRF